MFEEDFSVFTNPDEMGETATIGATSIDGIFNSEYVETVINGVPVAGEKPVFGCAESDLPSYTNGTEIVIKATTYKIRNWQPDSTGWITLILEEQ